MTEKTMSDHVVARAFKTVSRKFKVGDPIVEADVADAVLSFDELQAGGFISGGEQEAPPAPPADPAPSFRSS